MARTTPCSAKWLAQYEEQKQQDQNGDHEKYEPSRERNHLRASFLELFGPFLNLCRLLQVLLKCGELHSLHLEGFLLVRKFHLLGVTNFCEKLDYGVVIHAGRRVSWSGGRCRR